MSKNKASRSTDLGSRAAGCALVVGVTGLLASGKSTIVSLLAELAAAHTVKTYQYSLSDEIVTLMCLAEQGEAEWLGLSADLMAKLHRDLGQGQSRSRQNKVTLANELRRRHGSGILAQRVLDRIAQDVGASCSPQTLIIVDSIRNPGEIANFRHVFGDRFKLLAVEASAATLATRLLSRRRSDEDPKTLDDRRAMLRMRQQDGGAGQPDWGLQVTTCIQMADWRVLNDGSIEHLKDDLLRFWHQVLAPLWHGADTGSTHEGIEPYG